MNRPLLKFTGCLFAWLCLILIGQIPPSKAESQGQNASQSSQLNYKPKQKSIKKIKPANKSLILVPPPPPSQPSLLDWSGGFPDSISYLNADELSAKLEHIRKQIQNAKLQVKDSDLGLVESKDKAQRFNSLYTEGVVSRKELESAKKEATDMEQSADETKSNLADLEIQEGAIVRQLNLHKHKSKTKNQSHPNKNTKEHQSK